MFWKRKEKKQIYCKYGLVGFLVCGEISTFMDVLAKVFFSFSVLKMVF